MEENNQLMATDATLRDFFAAHAISNPINTTPLTFKDWIKNLFGKSHNGQTIGYEGNAKEAYKLADEMIRIRLTNQK